MSINHRFRYVLRIVNRLCWMAAGAALIVMLVGRFNYPQFTETQLLLGLWKYYLTLAIACVGIYKTRDA